MKRTILIAVCLSVFASIAFAQTPYVAVYFDMEDYSRSIAICPPEPIGAVIDSIYVVAGNFNMWMNAIEYAIEYPDVVLWGGDMIDDYGVLMIGNSPGGITLAWTLPANAFEPLLVQKARFIWMCTDNDIYACGEKHIRPVAHPVSGQIRAVRWPDLATFSAVGYWAVICPCISPTEETTWGGIKALYQ